MAVVEAAGGALVDVRAGILDVRNVGQGIADVADELLTAVGADAVALVARGAGAAFKAADGVLALDHGMAVAETVLALIDVVAGRVGVALDVASGAAGATLRANAGALVAIRASSAKVAAGCVGALNELVAVGHSTITFIDVDAAIAASTLIAGRAGNAVVGSGNILAIVGRMASSVVDEAFVDVDTSRDSVSLETFRACRAFIATFKIGASGVQSATAVVDFAFVDVQACLAVGGELVAKFALRVKAVKRSGDIGANFKRTLAGPFLLLALVDIKATFSSATVTKISRTALASVRAIGVRA